MDINGSLQFDASSASEIKNLRLQKLASNPTHTAADQGRLIWNTTDDVIYVGGPSAWIAIATGGNATALQAELDATQASIGPSVNADGTFNAGAFNTPIATATSITNAINQLATYADANNTLAELDDVTLTTPVASDLLQFNGTIWVNRAIGSVSGVQGWDAGLDALAAYNTNGILVQTADNTFAGRSLVAPAAGFTITNANGVSGNPTFTLANDLAALEGLATTGYVVRTGDGTATTRAIAGTAGRIVVSNGDGVSTDTNIDLETVGDSNTGTFEKFAVDTYGRVTGTTPVVTADITALVNGTYVNVSGDTMDNGADLIFAAGGTVTGLPAPTADTDAANKAYVDALSAGLSWKQAVRVATTANVALATDLENGDTIDSVILATGDRVLVKDQSTASQNGIYVVQASGAAVRATDMDAAAEFDGAAVFVKEGTVNQSSGWTQTATVNTVGTDAVTFSQFTGGALYTWGVGLQNTGNTININLGAGIIELPSDEVGIDLYDSATGAIILTSDGTSRSTANTSRLHLLLAGSGGLAQGASGLTIAADGVTNAMLVNEGFTFNGDTGTDNGINLGETVIFAGNATQGIATNVASGTVTITAVNATTTQKGVASFNTSHFSVTAGAVSLAASLDDLTNVSTADAAAANSLLQATGSGGDWVAVSPAAVGGTINLGDLADVGTATPTDGHVLVGDGAAWNNQKVYHLHDEASASTTWTVTHNLGQRYCNVTVVVADEVVIPQSISFTSTSQLVVTFNTAVAGKVVVMGVA